MISVHEDHQLWRLDPKRFSSWTKLVRVQAWVRRFIDNCRSPNRERGGLKAEEIEDAKIQQYTQSWAMQTSQMKS